MAGRTYGAFGGASPSGSLPLLRDHDHGPSATVTAGTGGRRAADLGEKRRMARTKMWLGSLALTVLAVLAYAGRRHINAAPPKHLPFLEERGHEQTVESTEPAGEQVNGKAKAWRRVIGNH
jgi:hypothetical protein